MVFGIMQLRQYRTQQRDLVAANLTRTFYHRDLARALSLMQDVPNGISQSKLKEMGLEYVEAAIIITTSFESMGFLVFKQVTTVEFVMDLAGGIIGTMSKKLANWQSDVRDAQNQPSWAEWFEWLGDKAIQHESETCPAYDLSCTKRMVSKRTKNQLSEASY
jgi:hypothetical protein